MRNLKIGIGIVVISAIAFFTIRSYIIPPPPLVKTVAENTYVKTIENEINILKIKPDNKFCYDFCEIVAGRIEEFHKNGKFSKVPSENNQLKEDLSKQLYAAYTEKFIQQAYYVFKRSEWKPEDLSLIRSETERLRKSNYLEKPSTFYSSFTEIQSILYQYDQITSFISFCKEFSYSGTSLSDRFPIQLVQADIAKANAYLSNNLDNPYVNNCTNLRIGLKELPQYFFNAQIRYLDNKINYWSGSYSIYNSQKAYNTGLYLPLKVEIEGLDNNLYNAANYDSERKRLLLKWQDEASKAYYHFN